MTAPSVIHDQRAQDLAAFRAVLQQLEGVSEEHLEHLARSGSSSYGSPPFPKYNDPVGVAAYQAAALRAITEAIVSQQERISQLEGQAQSKSKTKAAS